MREVDISRYVTSSLVGLRGKRLGFSGYKNGQTAAKELGVKNMAGEDIQLVVPKATTFVNQDFLSGFLRSLVNRQGLDETIKHVCTSNKQVVDGMLKFAEYERERLNNKQNKQKWEPDWAKPVPMAVPDVGTFLRLGEDWTFGLYCEGRNTDLFEGINFFENYDRWRFYRNLERYEMTAKGGAVLRVDRLYIRQNLSNYSSITFMCRKGHTLYIVYDGQLYDLTKTKVRFWVKLHDFNNAVVNMDMNTLPH